jgi:hypothetical protein
VDVDVDVDVDELELEFALIKTAPRRATIEGEVTLLVAEASLDACAHDLHTLVSIVWDREQLS